MFKYYVLKLYSINIGVMNFWIKYYYHIGAFIEISKCVLPISSGKI